VNPPAGCRFRDRCPFAFAKCTETPPFEEVKPGHLVACWKVSQGSAVTAGVGQEQAG
jgi:ABC-type dipeptide/oligopeptide/nickel transport system ATPase component